MSCENTTGIVDYNPIYDNMGFQNSLWPRSSVNTTVNCWVDNWWSPSQIPGVKFGRKLSKRRKSKSLKKRKSIKRRKSAVKRKKSKK